MKNLQKLRFIACLAIVPMQSYASSFSLRSMMSYASSMMSTASSKLQSVTPALLKTKASTLWNRCSETAVQGQEFMAKHSTELAHMGTLMQMQSVLTEGVINPVYKSAHGITPYQYYSGQGNQEDIRLKLDDSRPKLNEARKNAFMQEYTKQNGGFNYYSSLALAATSPLVTLLGYTFAASTAATLPLIGIDLPIAPTVGLLAAYVASSYMQSYDANIEQIKKDADAHVSTKMTVACQQEFIRAYERKRTLCLNAEAFIANNGFMVPQQCKILPNDMGIPTLEAFEKNSMTLLGNPLHEQYIHPHLLIKTMAMYNTIYKSLSFETFDKINVIISTYEDTQHDQQFKFYNITTEQVQSYFFISQKLSDEALTKKAEYEKQIKLISQYWLCVSYLAKHAPLVKKDETLYQAIIQQQAKHGNFGASAQTPIQAPALTQIPTLAASSNGRTRQQRKR